MPKIKVGDVVMISNGDYKDAYDLARFGVSGEVVRTDAVMDFDVKIYCPRLKRQDVAWYDYDELTPLGVSVVE